MVRGRPSRPLSSWPAARPARRAERLEADLAGPAGLGHHVAERVVLGQVEHRRLLQQQVRPGGAAHPSRSAGGCAAGCRPPPRPAATRASSSRWSVKTGTPGRRVRAPARCRPGATRQARPAPRRSAMARRCQRAVPVRADQRHPHGPPRAGHRPAPARVAATPSRADHRQPVRTRSTRTVVGAEPGRGEPERRGAPRPGPWVVTGAGAARPGSARQRVVQRQPAAVVGPAAGRTASRRPARARAWPRLGPAARRSAMVCSIRCGSFCEPSIATWMVRCPMAGLANRSSTDSPYRPTSTPGGGRSWARCPRRPAGAERRASRAGRALRRSSSSRPGAQVGHGGVDAVERPQLQPLPGRRRR